MVEKAKGDEHTLSTVSSSTSMASTVTDQAAKALPKPNDQSSKPTTVVTPPSSPYLEAHTMLPVADNTQSAIGWLYKIHQLPLAEPEIRAHLQIYAASYSVIDTVAQLRPDIVRLITSFVEGRDGHLVSVVQGRPAELHTIMGTLQAATYILILRIGLLDTMSLAQNYISGHPTQGSGGIFGQLPAQNYMSGQPVQGGGGLFGHAPPQTNMSGQPLQGSGGPFGLFGRPPPQTDMFGRPIQRSGGLFGQAPLPQTNLFGQPLQQSGGLFGQAPPQISGLGSTGALPSLFTNKSEPPTFVQTFAPYDIEHFQSIYANEGNRSISPEEQRVADYNAGRTGPDKTTVPSGSRTSLFGGPATAAATQDNGPSLFNTTGTPSVTQNTTPSSSSDIPAMRRNLFGNPTSSLFGTNSATMSSLFGNPPPPSNTPLSTGPLTSQFGTLFAPSPLASGPPPGELSPSDKPGPSGTSSANPKISTSAAAAAAAAAPTTTTTTTRNTTPPVVARFNQALALAIAEAEGKPAADGNGADGAAGEAKGKRDK
ncbi:hypothetical protein BDV95DRAFT_215057 [Massariosphaeria phaeospora]|uniref:Uncharacterized protein n=1 Tax=Massariosphaeria phaeospora TaxID=100035 RepID=A0A7C8MCW1_9PLEO|nr:hypothetical protein BDV95DRAFT_215057 [Massariosphaeria phaeospora]